MSQNLNREQIETYKIILTEAPSLSGAWNAARTVASNIWRSRPVATVKGAANRLWKAPGVAATVKTAGVAGAVAAGAYGAAKLLQPNTPQINPKDAKQPEINFGGSQKSYNQSNTTPSNSTMVNFDVATKMATSGSGTPRDYFKHVANLQNSGADINTRTSNITRTRALAANMAKADMQSAKQEHGKNSAEYKTAAASFNRWHTETSPIQPVERNGGGFGVGRGVGGKPVITGGSYVNPNSAEARVRADVDSGKLPASFGKYQGNRLPMDLAKEREDAGNAAFDKALDLPGASSMNRGNVAKTIADRNKQRDAKDPVLQGLNKDLADEQRANRIKATPEYADAVRELQTAKNKSTIAKNNDSSSALRFKSDAYAKWETGGYHNNDNDPVSPPENKPKYGVPELIAPNPPIADQPEAPKFNTSQEPQDFATKFAYDQRTNLRNTATKFADDQRTNLKNTATKFATAQKSEADRIKDVASNMKTRFANDANKSSGPVANAPLSLNPEDANKSSGPVANAPLSLNPEADRIKDVASNFAAQQRKQREAGRSPSQPGRPSRPPTLYRP